MNKLVTVDNITLQFDAPEEIVSTEEGIKNLIGHMNLVLQKEFAKTQPRIFLNKNTTITDIEMKEFLTIDQILSAARNDINRHSLDGKFVPIGEDIDHNEENFFTIESMYVQWAEDENLASQELWKMFEEEFSEYL